MYTFGNKQTRNPRTRCHLSKVEITDYYLMIDEKYFFDRIVKNIGAKYDKTRKRPTAPWDDYTTGCLYITIFKEQCKEDLKAIEKTYFWKP